MYYNNFFLFLFSLNFLFWPLLTDLMMPSDACRHMPLRMSGNSHLCPTGPFVGAAQQGFLMIADLVTPPRSDLKWQRFVEFKKYKNFNQPYVQYFSSDVTVNTSGGEFSVADTRLYTLPCQPIPPSVPQQHFWIESGFWITAPAQASATGLPCIRPCFICKKMYLITCPHSWYGMLR